MTTSTNKRVDDIFQDLQRRILRREFAPGDRLPPERNLAGQYDTNRNTLREAIRKLEQVGLVTVRQGRGVTIADYHRTGTMSLLGAYLEHGDDVAGRVEVLMDVLEARAAVLRIAVSRIARRAEAQDVARLRSIAASQIRAFEAEDRVALARGDVAWLDALVDGAHSLTVRWMANTFLEIYRGVIERFPSLWIMEDTYPAYLTALVDAIVDRDGERAAAVIGDFFERADRTLEGILSGLVEGADDASAAEVEPTTPREEA
ncbi:MAG: FadR/GntR family transcriptional regulator [Myxococcota bacterium]